MSFVITSHCTTSVHHVSLFTSIVNAALIVKNVSKFSNQKSIDSKCSILSLGGMYKNFQWRTVNLESIPFHEVWSKQNPLLKEIHTCPNTKFTPYKQSSQQTVPLQGSHNFWHTEKVLKGYQGAQLIISKTWSKRYEGCK